MLLIPIQIYFVICFLILFYTIGYIVYQRYYTHQEARLVSQYTKMISDQHLMLQQVGIIESSHLRLLAKKLRKNTQLIAFEKALAQLDELSDENDDYLRQLEAVILKLTAHYQHTDQMQQAYLAYFIAKYAARGKWENPALYRTLISYLNHPTVYLRENILLATYQQPDAKWIVKVLQYLTENQLFHHPKLIQDGLLTYPFDADVLIDTLWEQRHTFHAAIFLGLIGFITFKSDRYKEVFYQLLRQEKLDLEVRTSLMRYFKKHHLDKVEPVLIACTADEQDAVRTVAVFVLREYPSEQVIETLKLALKDSSWYVRRNAGQSLLAVDVSREDIADILEGDDRYAKEMLRYQLQEKRRTAYEPVR